VNNYEFTKEECIDIVNKMWKDYDWTKMAIKRSADYYKYIINQ